VAHVGFRVLVFEYSIRDFFEPENVNVFGVGASVFEYSLLDFESQTVGGWRTFWAEKGRLCFFNILNARCGRGLHCHPLSDCNGVSSVVNW
jgi:hypothetical protein